MRVDLDENGEKDVFHTIKTAIDYPLKSPLNKISYVRFCKLTQVTKNFKIYSSLCLPLTKNLSNRIKEQKVTEIFAHASQIIHFLLEAL